MRMRPVIGFQLLKGIDFLGDATQVVRSHHGRWDGRGYPDRLASEFVTMCDERGVTNPEGLHFVR